MEPYKKDTSNPEKKNDQFFDNNWHQGRLWAGLIVITVGAILIAREAGVDIPRWVVSTPMFLIALGLFIGVRSSFRNWIFLIPMGIGAALLVDRIFWDVNIKPFIWPVVVVLIGLFMIFRPKRKRDDRWNNWTKNNPEWNHQTVNPTGEDTIDTVAVFGSVQKNILSKDFRGGSVVSFMGGTELNLSQADMTQPVILEMTQVFGGSKLIVPSNWTIHSTELVSVFGGVEDKRMIAQNVDPTKILKLTGTNVFGGLEIKSY
jgi:predicted membrane protein